MTYRKLQNLLKSGDIKSMHEEEAVNDDRFHVETACSIRVCNPCGGKIRNGEKCLVFSKGSGRYRVSGNVCRKCLIKIVEKITKSEEAL